MTVRDVAHLAVEQATALCRAEGRLQLTEWEAYRVLRHWQIPVAPCYLVTDPVQAGAVAAQIDGRAAVKIVSPDIGHKTEAGCVRLGLSGSNEVAAACAEVLAGARLYNPAARIHGVMIQQMAKPGVEIIAGGLQDPSFGPVLMVGLGGIFTEVMKDVRFRLAPINVDQADEMLRELKGFPLLTGVRGKPPVDLNALALVLVNLSRLLEIWPDLKELDLNPLIASEHGVVAVDALVTLKEA